MIANIAADQDVDVGRLLLILDRHHPRRGGRLSLVLFEVLLEAADNLFGVRDSLRVRIFLCGSDLLCERV